MGIPLEVILQFQLYMSSQFYPEWRATVADGTQRKPPSNTYGRDLCRARVAKSRFWGTLVDVLAVTHSLFHHDTRFGYERRLCAHERPSETRAHSANLKITSRSLMIHRCSVVSFRAVGLRLNEYLRPGIPRNPPPLSRRNTESPPFALVVSRRDLA